jgi:hypothetical protein
MRFRTILSLATLFLACFTLAVWAEPLPSQPISNNLNSSPDSASVAGKISSVGDASFTLDIKKSQDSQTLQFEIDGNTKVEGKLAVGAQATVEYRADGDKYIATHVVVQPSSGILPN